MHVRIYICMYVFRYVCVLETVKERTVSPVVI
jgi:hypothetical protein